MPGFALTAVTSDTLKFSAAFTGRKYCHSKPGICINDAPAQRDGLVDGMRLLKLGRGPPFSASNWKKKQYLARNWLRFVKGRRSPAKPAWWPCATRWVAQPLWARGLSWASARVRGVE